MSRRWKTAVAMDLDLTLSGTDEAKQATNRRRLARPVWAEEAIHARPVDVDVEAVDGHYTISVLLSKAFYFYDRHTTSSSRARTSSARSPGPAPSVRRSGRQRI